jgi:hypothetical protein
MTRADLLAAKRKGHTCAISRDRVAIGKIDRQLVSTHKTYAEAVKALQNSKGNAIYELDDLID